MERVTSMLRARQEELTAPGARSTVIVLPEMSFTGYVFRGRDEILPLCETGLDPDERTRRWCAQTATEFKAFVQCGFPQMVVKEEGEGGEDILFNSVMLVDPQGDLVTLYAKHFLYETDEVWASEGPDFSSLQVKGLDCAVGPAICMDINPWRFQAPFQAMEFACFHRDHGTRLLLFSANWLLSPEVEQEDGPLLEGVDTAESPKERNKAVQYFGTRLSPLAGLGEGPLLFVAANRTGVERKAAFSGRSMVVDMHSRALLGVLGSQEEALLVVDADHPHPGKGQ